MRELLGFYEHELIETHVFHGPRHGADVAGVRGLDEHDADVGGDHLLRFDYWRPVWATPFWARAARTRPLSQVFRSACVATPAAVYGVYLSCMRFSISLSRRLAAPAKSLSGI